MSIQLFKITVGKTTVVVKQPQMVDIENGMQVAGNRPGVNQYLFGLLFAKELLKNTIKKVNDKDVSKMELEAIDKLLTPGEIAACGSKLQEIMQMGETANDVKVEILSSGDK